MQEVLPEKLLVSQFKVYRKLEIVRADGSPLGRERSASTLLTLAHVHLQY